MTDEKSTLRVFPLFTQQVIDPAAAYHRGINAWVGQPTRYDGSQEVLGVIEDGMHAGSEIKFGNREDFKFLEDQWWRPATPTDWSHDSILRVPMSVTWPDGQQAHIICRELKFEPQSEARCCRLVRRVRSLGTKRGLRKACRSAISAGRTVASGASSLWTLGGDLVSTTYSVWGAPVAATYQNRKLGGEQRDGDSYLVVKIRRGRMLARRKHTDRWDLPARSAQYDPGEDLAAFTGEFTTDNALPLEHAQAVADAKNRVLSVQRKVAGALLFSASTIGLAVAEELTNVNVSWF